MISTTPNSTYNDVSILALQVHPNGQTIPTINAICQRLSAIIEVLQTQPQFSTELGQRKVEEITGKITFNPGPNSPELSTWERTSRFLSNMMIKEASEATAPILPPETLPFIHALNYVDREVLPIDMKKLEPNKICDILKRINALVVGSTSSKSQYRNHPTVIFDATIVPHEKTKESFQQLDKKVRELSNDNEWEIWKSQTRAKVWHSEFAKNYKPMILDQNDAKVIRHIAEILNNEKDIQDQMRIFAKKLITWINTEKEDPYRVMAKAHHCFTKIHPFTDGNGRTIRLLLAWIAEQYQVSMPLMGSDEEYTKATKEGEEGFYNYLKDMIGRQPTVPPFMKSVFRDIYNVSLNY